MPVLQPFGVLVDEKVCNARNSRTTEDFHIPSQSVVLIPGPFFFFFIAFPVQHSLPYHAMDLKDVGIIVILPAVTLQKH